jgi:acetyl-CoA decarbonylase/synthase complex subunit gamma
MRRKRFPAGERFLVSLTHFSQALPLTLAAALLFSAAEAFLGLHGSVGENIGHNVLLALGSLFGGSILTGLFLPILPGRAFSVKSLTPAALFFLGGWFFYYAPAGTGLYGAGKLLLFCIWICYQGLNLTGSSTYTSLSGVRREMRYAVPSMAAVLAVALIGIIYGGFLL